MTTDVKTFDNSPLVSCLCVTENRPAFIPWLLWNFDRQSWDQRELIIVDSSPEPVQIARDDVRVIVATPGLNIPSKRNIALKAATGDIITWFDDDDWQHPCKLEWLVEGLQDGAPYAGTSQGWFVDLMADRCRPYHSPRGRIVFNSAGFRRSAVANILFPETVHKASDTRWMQQIERRYARRVVKIPRKAIFFWLCHTNNLSNPATKRQNTQSLDTVRQIVAQSWGETDEQLATLRARLAEKPVRPVAASSLNTEQPRVSACLLSWKRPHNLQRIVDSLGQHNFIGEILVWNNNPNIALRLAGSKVRIIQSEANEICYGRFLCAREARFDIIYTQDDDVLVQNVATLYRRFLQDDSCITHALASQHMRQQARYQYPEGHHAMLGWGSFFRKEWLSTLDSYVLQHGSDEILRWGADKIFTILLNRTHNTCPAKLYPLPHGTTKGIAMYRDADHQRKNSLAVRQALAALRERKSVPYPVTWNVVITCYNYGHYLAEAIESVLNNDADYVITIVDDASTDETEQIGQKYSAQYPHINYLRLPTNRGVSYARNHGVAAVNSLFVVLLDADDKIGPNYLYEAEQLLRSGCDVANPDAILFGQHNARWQVKPTVTLSMLLEKNQVHCAAAFRRGYWVQVGGIAEHMTHWMDYHFWVQLAKAGARIRRLSGDHFFYRKHGHSKSAEATQKREDLMRLIRVEGTLT
jgi:glycosyltransferase involved in cell wall biosynthesis